MRNSTGNNFTDMLVKISEKTWDIVASGVSLFVDGLVNLMEMTANFVDDIKDRLSGRN